MPSCGHRVRVNWGGMPSCGHRVMAACAYSLDGTSAVGRAKSDPDNLAHEVTSYERLRARYLKLKAKLLRPPYNPKTVLALLDEALK